MFLFSFFFKKQWFIPWCPSFWLWLLKAFTPGSSPERSSGKNFKRCCPWSASKDLQKHCVKKIMLFQKRTCTLFHKLSQNLTIMFILHSCTTTMTPQGFYSKSLLHAMHFAWEKFLWGKRRITEIYLLRFLDISWKYSSFY